MEEPDESRSKVKGHYRNGETSDGSRKPLGMKQSKRNMSFLFQIRLTSMEGVPSGMSLVTKHYEATPQEFKTNKEFLKGTNWNELGKIVQ